MQAEPAEQIGYEKSGAGEKPTGNRRNGKRVKTLRADQRPMEIEVPRDRDGEFEPRIVPKHRREWRGFDVTDEVKGLVDDWRSRPLEPMYPVVFFDALRVNIRDEGRVVKKAVYIALAIRLDGQKEALGMRVERNEGSKFWLGILNELKNRGVGDILIAAVDGLAGFPEAINAVFPKTEVQLCIVHMVRNSVKYVPYKDRRAVAADLKEIYLAPSADAAKAALERFAGKWDGKYPAISKSWQGRWNEVVPYMKFSPEIRWAIYTTNVIESLNSTLQRNLKARLSFPGDEAAMKLIFMILRRTSKKWTMPIRNWGSAMHQFAVIYGDRVPL